MFKKAFRTPCNEMEQILQYLDDTFKGNDAKVPQVERPENVKLLNYLEILLDKERNMAKSSRGILDTITTKLQSIDGNITS